MSWTGHAERDGYIPRLVTPSVTATLAMRARILRVLDRASVSTSRRAGRPEELPATPEDELPLRPEIPAPDRLRAPVRGTIVVVVEQGVPEPGPKGAAHGRTARAVASPVRASSRGGRDRAGGADRVTGGLGLAIRDRRSHFRARRLAHVRLLLRLGQADRRQDQCHADRREEQSRHANPPRPWNSSLMDRPGGGWAWGNSGPANGWGRGGRSVASA